MRHHPYPETAVEHTEEGTRQMQDLAPLPVAGESPAIPVSPEEDEAWRVAAYLNRLRRRRDAQDSPEEVPRGA
jgi:hypothetical protein